MTESRLSMDVAFSSLFRTAGFLFLFNMFYILLLLSKHMECIPDPPPEVSQL
ncbi:hypothetical protein RND71_036976 [Anisodus tanguticus]|uniref:Uncharacterized protein n=1 Tax=Anisodus tanguticus TaxID=243964 RepID=A0AAE1UUM8_9SOLA|nr:hypothetical protein RND71_036976 [Anisodus tanguticus]